MSVWWLALAHGATWSVPGDFPTVVDAVAAAQSGDVIEVGPGTWTGRISADVPLTLRSTDGPTTTVLASAEPTVPTISNAVDLTVEGFTLICTGSGGLRNYADTTLTDVVLTGCTTAPALDVLPALSGQPTTTRMTDVRLEDPPASATAVVTENTNLILERVEVSGPATPSTGGLFSSVGGSWIFTDVTVSDLDLSAAVFEGSGLGSAVWTRVDIHCTAADGGASIDAGTTTLEAVRMWKVSTNAWPLLDLWGLVDAEHLTLAGTETQPLIGAGSGAILTLRNSALVYGSAAVSGNPVSLEGSYNLFAPGMSVHTDPTWANALSGDGTLTTEPQFAAWSANGPCDQDDLSPAVGSPLLDAGAPGTFDADGTAADLGASGGPEGYGLSITDSDQDGVQDPDDCAPFDPTISPWADDIPYDGQDQDCDGADLTDVDGDGFDAAQVGGPDCDDTDPTVHPEAEEDPGPVDRDCDGLSDPTLPIEPVGCTTAPSPGAPMVLLFLLPFVLRRP